MRQILLIVAVFLITACAPQPVVPAKGKFKNFGISLEAKSSQGKVKILSKPQGMNKNGKQNGYIGFEYGQSGNVLFTVKNQDLSATCADDAEWVITQIALTAYGDASSEKGDDASFEQKQPLWLEEAFPAVDHTKNGYVLNVSKADAQTFAIVKNNNPHDSEKMIYYRVILTPCDDQDGKLKPLKTDPAIRNGGRPA